jgi:hypothetical protein
MPVKVIPKYFEKEIKVLCKPSTCAEIEKQIANKMMEASEYRIPLYQRAYNHLQKNMGEILPDEWKQHLKIKFEPITKALLIEGSLALLEKVREKLMVVLKALKDSSQEGCEDSAICPLCYEERRHPFMLQGCGHSFCLGCLQLSIKYTLNDISQFPVRCPQCSELVWISDMDCLVEEGDWPKLSMMAANQFVLRRPGEYMFCLSADCKAICEIKLKSFYYCNECKRGYCITCMNPSHPGLTCHEARYGSDKAFGEYLQQVGGRTCANRSCKASLVRISGCYKVQCGRCKKCMCFKCPPQSMVAYDTAEEAYAHLDKKHGGYF